VRLASSGSEVAVSSGMDRKKNLEEPMPQSKEPQSYGSGPDWVTGRTGQTVEDTPHRTSRHDEEFYEDRHLDDRSPGARGGLPNEVQRSEGVDFPQPDRSETPTEGTGTTKVSDNSDQRTSWFRERDYPEE
jgi:hypothetical protein